MYPTCVNPVSRLRAPRAASLLSWVQANTVLVVTTAAAVAGAAALMAYPGQYVDARDAVAYVR